jgi:hypothetical protein
MARLYRRPDEPGGNYYLDYTDANGRRQRRSLETALLKEAKQRRDDLVSGTIKLKWGRRGQDCTPDDFWALHATDPALDTGKYIAWARDHKTRATLERERVVWAQFVEALRPKTLGTVLAQDVERFKQYHRTPRRTAKGELSAVRANGTINKASGA